MAKQKDYEFPNAVIRRMGNGTYREFPKWCQMISVEVPRRFVAEALCALRRFRRGEQP